MNRKTLLGFIHFILIAAFQIFILNGVELFGYFNPMVYIWFILMLPTNTPKWLILVLSFAMGFTIDIFAGQLGFHAAALTLIGFIRPLFIKFFFSSKDLDNSLRPSISEMGLNAFLPYVAILVFIHHFLYFTIEIFSLSEFFYTFIRVVLSSISTISIILLLDYLFIRQKR